MRHWYVFKHPRRKKLVNVIVKAESEKESLSKLPPSTINGEVLYGFIGIIKE